MGGSLEFEELTKATQGKKQESIKYFVETGTYKADTTLMAAKHYEKVFTTEIVPALYEASRARAAEEKVDNIEFMLGDSVKLLEKIVPQVKEGAIFFIDAHQSGGDTSNNGTRVPLLEELEVILKHKVGPSVFIIDDLRLWKGRVWDWAHVTNNEIVKRFIKHGYEVASFYEHNDRFYVITN